MKLMMPPQPLALLDRRVSQEHLAGTGKAQVKISSSSGSSNRPMPDKELI